MSQTPSRIWHPHDQLVLQNTYAAAHHNTLRTFQQNSNRRFWLRTPDYIKKKHTHVKLTHQKFYIPETLGARVKNYSLHCILQRAALQNRLCLTTKILAKPCFGQHVCIFSVYFATVFRSVERGRNEISHAKRKHYCDLDRETFASWNYLTSKSSRPQPRVNKKKRQACTNARPPPLRDIIRCSLSASTTVYCPIKSPQNSQTLWPRHQLDSRIGTIEHALAISYCRTRDHLHSFHHKLKWEIHTSWHLRPTVPTSGWRLHLGAVSLPTTKRPPGGPSCSADGIDPWK